MANGHQSCMLPPASEWREFYGGVYPSGRIAIGGRGLPHPRSRDASATKVVFGRRVITRSDDCLKLFTGSTWWHIGRGDLVRILARASARTPGPSPLLVHFSTDLEELRESVPEVEGLFLAVLDGVRRAIDDSLPVRASIGLERDAELPSWRQLVITIRPRVGLTDAEAFELWDRLEERVRPRLERYAADHREALSRAPVDLSNENISIRLKW